MVHHHPADVLEVAVATVPPAGILDEVDPFGAENVGDPDRIAGPWSCLRHITSPIEALQPDTDGPEDLLPWYPRA